MSSQRQIRPETQLETQLELLMKLVSPRTGLIRRLTRMARNAEEPNPPVLYQALLSHFNFRTATELERSGGGKGETETQSILSAIGEALERYCAQHYHPTWFLRAPFADISAAALSPVECVLYAEEQYARPGFPYARFNPWQPLSWLRGWTLPDRRALWTPASLVYLNYFGDAPQEYLCSSTSNGLAAGPDLESALLSAFYELVERDALIINWMNRLPAPQVNCEALGGLSQTIIRHYRRSGLAVVVFHLATDIPIPVMMAMAIDRREDGVRGPAAVAGLGCDLEPAEAVRKSLLELCQVRPGETAKFANRPSDGRLRSYQQVRTLADHSSFFASPERMGELSFLLNQQRSKSPAEIADHGGGDPAADLTTVIRLLNEAGCRTAFAEITTPDLADFPVRVVRAFATGLQPMHFGHGEERLGGSRLFTVARALGVDDRIRTAADLNPCPHPLG
jgi:ribosomal protein S12 methylthiotransferase accessory factor